jgi:hypothetical protein
MESKTCLAKNNMNMKNTNLKNIFLTLAVALFSSFAFAQDFASNIATAKSSYASGNLEDARFAMQQMLTDLDMAIGKEVLKMLPEKMDALVFNTKSDNVSANSGIVGAMIHRDYGMDDNMMIIEVMTNSPLVGSLNAILNMPFMGNSSDGSQKNVKIQGYKGILQKSVDSETNKTDFTLQIPLNNTLLTFTAPNSTEADVLRLANGIKVSDIAKMVQ